MAFHLRQHHTTSRVLTQTLEIYGREAHQFLARWGKPHYKRPALLAELLMSLPKRAVLLDLGCGGGQDVRYLAMRGYRVIGIDRTLPLLQFARKRHPPVPLLLADMRAMPIQAGSLDGIWAAASLMHLPKVVARDALVTLFGCLRPGGLLAATVTYGTRSQILKRGWIPGRYFARWRKVELACALRRAGWSIVSLRVVNNRERKGRWINVIAERGAS